MAALFRVYSEWLRSRYGEKVYKIPVNIPVTCPNRDGTLGVGGCIYCGARGGGHENLPDSMALKEQILETCVHIEKKYKAHRFIVFFQSFSNTYMPFDRFKATINQVLDVPGLVGIAVATRPDCILESHLAFLNQIQSEHGLDVCIELGLQTANDHTLDKINRGHGLGAYILAANGVKQHGLQLCTHVILDLPWDDRQDVITTAEVVSAVKSDFVKCHALYVEQGTRLAEWLFSGDVSLYDQNEYIERCMLFLSHLDPEVVIQRLIGRMPEQDSIVTNWNTSWWKVRDRLLTEMEKRSIEQGCCWGQAKAKVAEKIV